MPTIKQTSLRWALALAAILAMMAGLATGAKASTGGASGYAPAAPEGGELAFTPFRYAGASWYGGPSMWGRQTACGATLRPNTLGVAHKTLPCGTTVKFLYHGHVLVTQVIDRGPYVKGRSWDFTKAASEVLGFEGVGRVRYAVAISYARSR
ncbi:MAG TPA: septal ring lytic transglycosylase RlpA family protein [Solirubrobacterales bacterium]|nr:septal ring lytic transglycosylase RlpA family protein [Solirubrobacterales bacterium]